MYKKFELQLFANMLLQSLLKFYWFWLDEFFASTDEVMWLVNINSGRNYHIVLSVETNDTVSAGESETAL